MLQVNNCWCSPTWRLTFSVNIFRIRSFRSMIWASHIACICWYVTIIPRLIYNSINVIIYTPYNWCLHFVYQFSITAAYSLRACCMNVVAKITVSARRGENMWWVPTSLPSPFLSFWKNNIAMTLTIMSVRNRFLEGCRSWAISLGRFSILMFFKLGYVKLSLCNNSTISGCMSS